MLRPRNSCSPPIALLPSGAIALPTTVAAGQNTSLTTNVDTSAAGSLSGELSFATNDADENPF
ncbi:MAG: hypothetical protein F6J93_13195, partial [Oscillatoria sp. SIO1A7]|nr:hypothetical protein [Oscillatoria sp. SIO1A7]